MNSLAGLNGLTPILMIGIFAYLYAMGARDEPRANLVKTFLLGVIGMFFGLFVSVPLRMLDVRSVSPFADAVLASIVFASIPGESVKLLIVNYYCQRLRSFASLPVGIIYGGIAALGFTLADHIAFSSPHLWFVPTVRALVAVPLHVATGGIMGYALAQRMFVRDSRWTIAKGWALGVAAHSIFNLLWLTSGLCRANGGTSWIIRNGFPIMAISLVIVLGGWISRRLYQARSAQLLQVAAHTTVKPATDPSFLERLKAVDRSDESE